MAATSATFSPATLSATPSVTSGHQQRRIPRVKYITGVNSFNGLKAHNYVAQLGLSPCADFSFAKIVNSLNRTSRNGNGGGAMAVQCNAAAEIFRIAAVMNGLTLVGVAVGFVLLRIEAFVEENE